jgi:hypothetical protein
MPQNIADLFDLADDVALDVPGCLAPTIQRMLTRVCRDFLYKSKVWAEDLALIDVVARQTDYNLKLPYSAVIMNISSLKIRNDITHDFETADEYPQAYYTYVPENILRFVSVNFAPQRAIAQGMKISVILVPKFNAQNIPNWLVERYAEGFVAGAKAELMMSPQKPYTNPQLASYNKGIFNSYLTRASNDAERRFLPRTISIGA